MAIADFVMLHNKAAEALAKSDRVGFDFYNGVYQAHREFIKKERPPLRVYQEGVRAAIGSFIDKFPDTAPFGNRPVDGLRH